MSRVPLVLFAIALGLPGLAAAQEGAERVALCGLTVAVGQREVDLDGGGCEPGDLALLTKLVAVETLSLADTPTTDAVLASLRGNGTIRRLDLQRVRITNEGLGHLATFTKLERLDLRENEGLTGAGLARLAPLSSLRVLGLSTGQVTDVGAAHLAKLFAAIPGLRTVETGDVGMSRTCSGEERHCLDLSRGSVTNAGLKALVPSGVTDLLLDPEAIDDGTLALLARMERLSTINCTRTKVLPSGEPATGCADLLGAHKVTKAGLRSLAKLELRYLRVAPELLAGQGLATLTGIKGFRSLNCGGDFCEPELVNTCESWWVADACVSLKGVPPAALDLGPLGRLAEVRRLLLPRGFVLDPGAGRRIRGIKGLGALGEPVSLGRGEAPGGHLEVALDLRSLELADGGLAELVQLPRLGTLVLPEREVTPAVVEILRRAKTLRSLDLRLSKISAAEARALVAFPGLERLSVPPAAVEQGVVDGALASSSLKALNFGVEECVQSCSRADRCCEGCVSACVDDCALGGDLLVLDLAKTPLGRGRVAGLEKASRPLRLMQDEVTDDLLEWASSLPRLESLGCAAPRCVDLRRQKRVSRAGLGHLAQLADLERLYVDRPLVDGELVELLGSLPHLRAFNLRDREADGFDLRSERPLPASAIRRLKGIEKLRRVVLSGISDEVLKVLATFPELEAVNCWFYDEQWPEGERCVNLIGSKVTRTGLEALPRFRKIHRFVVPPALLDDASLGLITGAPGFESLNCPRHTVGCTEMGGTELVPACVGLHQGSRVTDRGIARLRGRIGHLLIEAPPPVEDGTEEDDEAARDANAKRYIELLPGTIIVDTLDWQTAEGIESF